MSEIWHGIYFVSLALASRGPSRSSSRPGTLANLSDVQDVDCLLTPTPEDMRLYCRRLNALWCAVAHRPDPTVFAGQTPSTINKGLIDAQP